ncbi:MAG: hypothetical protein FWD57_15910 [Polyangiaceae bacterium]|nr:hypothetical protein [Polyangiaceae bacterium]
MRRPILIYIQPTGKHAANLLVSGVFLIAPGGIAVEGEVGATGIVDWESSVLDVFDDVGSAEVSSRPNIDEDVGDLTCDDVLFCMVG